MVSFRKLYSHTWVRQLEYREMKRFSILGFRWPADFLEIRIFDFLNLYKVDSGIAEELIIELYKFLNPNLDVDEAMICGEMDQTFEYARWNKLHQDLSTVTIKDIVLTEDINKAAIIHIYKRVCDAFYKSQEYDCRHYKYGSLSELRRSRNHEQA